MDKGNKEEETWVSFGLIPVKKEQNIYQFLLLKHKNWEGGVDHWSFCKGGPEPGETELQTAERELREETNLTLKKWLKGKDGELLSGLMQYEAGKRKIPKTVRLYVGEVEGEVEIQAEEISESRWVNIDDVESLITYEQEKQLWRELKDKISW